MTKENTEVVKKTEEEKVEDWWLSRYSKMTPPLPYDDIVTLVVNKISPHDAEAVMKKGCPPELVAAVLVGSDQ